MQLSKNTHWITPVRENRVWFLFLELPQMPAPLARNFVSLPSVYYERLTYLKTESDFEGGVGLTGLEPVTLRLSSACSNQLSYRPGFTRKMLPIKLVEAWGFEPQTYSLQSYRSTS